MQSADLIRSIFSDDPDMLALLGSRKNPQLESLRDLLRGERGLRGEQGLQGIPGKDGATGRDGMAGKDGSSGASGKDGRDGKDGTDGRDGKDAVPKELNEDAIVGKVVTKVSTKIPTVDEIVKEIKEKKLLELRDIKGARLDAPSNKKFDMSDQRWHGAGGTTSSGANVTTQYLLTAVQSGGNVTIDLSQLAHFATFGTLLVVYRNNIPQTQGASYNFTATSSQVTIFNADASEIFNITYSYA